MKPYNIIRQRDFIFLRSLFIAFNNILNNKFNYKLDIGDNKTKEIVINFYYSHSGNSRFNDQFINLDDCNIDKVDGLVNKIPYGIFHLTDINVNHSDLTNDSFIMRYVNNTEDGTINTRVAKTKFIPLITTFKVKIIVDTMIDYLTIMQLGLELFYVNIQFKFNYNGIVIDNNAAFNFTMIKGNEKIIDYTYNDEKNTEIIFDVAVNTFYPIIDKNTDMPADNVIKNILSSNNLPGDTFENMDQYDLPRQGGYNNDIDYDFLSVNSSIYIDVNSKKVKYNDKPEPTNPI